MGYWEDYAHMWENEVGPLDREERTPPTLEPEGQKIPVLQPEGKKIPVLQPEMRKTPVLENAPPTKTPLESEEISMSTPEMSVDPQVEESYNRFVQAETRGTADRHKDDDGQYWKRTLQAEEGTNGSSAFGPAQITASLFKDVKARKDTFDITEEEEVYLDFFIKQGDMFLKHGNEEGSEGYDRRFDYAAKDGGGEGYMNDPEVMNQYGGKDKVKAMYKSIAQKIMQRHLKDTDGDVNMAVQLWRGKPQEEDRAYWKRYHS